MKSLITRERIKAFLLLTLGAVIAAFSLEEFLVPNNIFDGGVTGISMIIGHYIPVPIGIVIIVVNLPFLVFGMMKMGHAFIFKVGYAIVVFSAMTSVFAPFTNATEDTILAVTFGGVFLGLGVGLVLRGGGALDGTEIVAIVLNRRLVFSTGQIVLGFNCVIYTVAGIIFGMDNGMYSLLMYIITSRVIDVVEVGLDNTKSVMIISDHGKEVAEKIYKELGRTVTFLKGTGYISKYEKDVLYCVMTRAEIYDLKRIVNEVEGSSFTTISDVSEIVGNHIKSN